MLYLYEDRLVYPEGPLSSVPHSSVGRVSPVSFTRLVSSSSDPDLRTYESDSLDLRVVIHRDSSVTFEVRPLLGDICERFRVVLSVYLRGTGNGRDGCTDTGRGVGEDSLGWHNIPLVIWVCFFPFVSSNSGKGTEGCRPNEGRISLFGPPSLSSNVSLLQGSKLTLCRNL